MTMQPITDDMLTKSEICVAVAKCERALSCEHTERQAAVAD